MIIFLLNFNGKILDSLISLFTLTLNVNLYICRYIMSIAIVFPGQGSQYVGMGKDLYEKFYDVRELYDSANKILDFDLKKICFEGPEDELKQTYITQPAILVHSLAVAKLIGDKINGSYTAGHSLGEFTSFVYAGALSFEQGLKLVKLRGELMQRAGEHTKGTMAAVIGLSRDAIIEVCFKASEVGVVHPANYNSPGQVVISGSVHGVRKAMEHAKVDGAKLVKELVVHGAFHSPLMESAREGLHNALEETEFSPLKIPVYMNYTSKPVNSSTPVAEIKNNLYHQLTSPVLWEDCVNNMIADGAREFIEFGPGKVLQGLVKRINNSESVRGFDKANEIETLLNS